MDINVEVALRRGDLQHDGGLFEKNGQLIVIEPVHAADSMRNPEEMATVAPFGRPVDFAVTTHNIFAPGGQHHR